jgi:hypothetical protein
MNSRVPPLINRLKGNAARRGIESVAKGAASFGGYMIIEGWATVYDETNNHTFDKAIFIYSTQAQAERAAERCSEEDQKRLIGGRPQRIRVEVLI